MTDTAGETERLIAMMARHGIAAFDYRDGERSIRIVNGVLEEDALQDDMPAAAGPEVPVSHVRSPGVGRFRRATDRPLPLAVSKGDIIGFVASGVLRLPVLAPADGVLLSVCHADETPVGYDAALFDYRQHA